MPLARIEIDVDLLRAVADGKVDLKLEDITVNTISLFELQAKAAKLKVPANFVIEAIEAILKTFKIEQFHKPKIIEVASEIRNMLPDYIDCVIVATAVSLKNDLLTEDSLILSRRGSIKQKYGIKISKFSEFVGK